MRCQFCGWDNPDGKENCEKCGKPLQADAVESVKVQTGYRNERPTTRQPVRNMADMKATVRESRLEDVAANVLEEQTECPECGYILENGVCPFCGYDSNANNNEIINDNTDNMNADAKKTVRPRRKGEKGGRFVLTPISEDTGMAEADFIQFEGNEVQLNRDNTDPNNKTITSQLQAVITYQDGKWSIEDKSEYKTTFVQAEHKIELQNGSLILLGNQLYQFNSLSE